MITSNGYKVSLRGNAIEITEEFVHVIRAVKNALTEVYGEESAKVVIAMSGKIAFAIDGLEEASEEEIEKMKDEMLNMLLIEINDTKEN